MLKRILDPTVHEGCRRVREAHTVCDLLMGISPAPMLPLPRELADLELLEDPDNRPYIWDLEEE